MSIYVVFKETAAPFLPTRTKQDACALTVVKSSCKLWES